MSTAEVSRAKAKLVAEGLISIEPHEQGSRHPHHIKIVEVWHKNHALYHQVPLTYPGELTNDSSLTQGNCHLPTVSEQIQPSLTQGKGAESAPDTPNIPLKDLLIKDTLRAPVKKRETEITEEFRAAMRERFAPTLGATVEERINEALAHKARLKYTDIQQYVQGWLRRDAERVGTTGPPGNGRYRGQLTLHERRLEMERGTPPLRQPRRPGVKETENATPGVRDS